MSRWVLRAGLVLAGAFVLAACHGGPHEFIVNTTVDGSDATPGDGVCEMTPGGGDCSVRAAIDEANADANIGIIRLPEGTYTLAAAGVDDTNAAGDLDVDPAVADMLILVGEGAGAVIDGAGLDGVLDVHSKVVLANRVALRNSGGPGGVVRSGATLSFSQSASHDNAGAGIVTDAGAIANVLHATLSANGGGGATGAGTFNMDYSTVKNNSGGGMLVSGTTTIGANIIAEQAGGPDCAGPPTASKGYNLDSDGTCGLVGPTEAPSTASGLAALSADPVPHHHPQVGSAALDVVPAADPFCQGAFYNMDQRSQARPIGPACDRGAIEALDFVVSTTVDGPDADPGDGVCEMSPGGGNCSLRAAVMEANASGEDIRVTLGTSQTYLLSVPGAGEDAGATGDLDVSGSLTVVGNGSTVDGGGLDRVFEVRPGASLTLDPMTIRGGATAGGGGGILGRQGSDLELVNVAVTDNTADRGGGVFVDNDATFSAAGSTLSGNSATQGGGLYTNSGTTSFLGNVTISANSASGNGAGIWNQASLTLIHATVTANVGSGPFTAGGIRNEAGTVAVSASIIADQTVGRDCTAGGGTTIVSGGYNLESAGSCGLTGSGDQQSTPAGLDPLGGYGGPTDVHLPQDTSAAVDVIPAATPGLCDGTTPTDQRGILRPQNSDCDTGAVERAGSFTVTHGGDDTDANPGDGVCQDTSGAAGDCSLRAAVVETNALPDADSITIDPAVGTVTLTIPGTGEDASATGDLDITDELTINGNGTTIDGASLDRVIHHHQGSLAIADITITGGRTGTGAGMYSYADLTLVRVTFTGNLGICSALACGGGAFVWNNTVSITDSTFSANESIRGVGGLAARGGAVVTVERSTFDDNPGGIYAQSSQMTIVDSEITNSRGQRGVEFDDVTGEITGSTISGNGGHGVEAAKQAVSITNSTISGNGGAGVYGMADVKASTLTGNRGGGASGWDISLTATVVNPSAGAACQHLNPPGVVSGGWNLLTDASCAFDGPTDLEVTNPILDDLADNGGATPTHLLHSNSPALHAIPVGTPDVCDGSIPTDQRADARPVGGGCDIGAVEGETGASPAPLTLVVTTALDGRDLAPGNGICSSVFGCTLRAAIDESNAWPASDTITIAAGIDPTITRGGFDEDLNDVGDFDIWGHTTINGGGATIDASELDRVLHQHAGRLVISELTLTNGETPWMIPNEAVDGVGMRSTGVLDLDNVTVEGNSSTYNGSVSGGGIDLVYAVATITNSAIVDNYTNGGFGGGLAANASTVTLTDTLVSRNRGQCCSGGTGLHFRDSTADLTRVEISDNRKFGSTGPGVGIIDSQVTIAGSTISGNQAGHSVSGIEVSGSGSVVDIDNSTVSGNIGGASLWVRGGSVDVAFSTFVDHQGSQTVRVDASGTLTLSASVVDTSLIEGGGIACSGSVGSGGWNVVADTTCGLTQPTDLESTDPLLGALADNGGPTLTHLPLGGSPLLNAIPVGTAGLCDGTIPTDQRGVARPDGVDCDAGAVEGAAAVAVPLDLVVDSPLDAPDINPGDSICDVGDGTCTLRAALDETNPWPSVDTITIAPGINPVLSIAGGDEDANVTGDLDILADVTIDGQGAVVDGNGLDRVLHVAPGGGQPTVSLVNLTVTGGSTATSPAPHGGGIHLTDGTLQLTNVSVANNSATGAAAPRGGGIYQAGGTLVINDSTVSGNTASNPSVSPAGGGLYQAGGTLSVTNSTISGNAASGTFFSGGGGVYVMNATIAATTISGNTSIYGKAIYSTGAVTVSGSVLNGSSIRTCTGTVTSAGYNVGSDASCGLTQLSDLPSTDPLLGSLADNGGPTLTHLPQAGSPLIDAITAGTGNLCDGTIPADQRGVARPQNIDCDTGSVEQ